MKKDKLLDKAIRLRLKGYAIGEIAKILVIGKGTASEWLRDIKLPESAKKRLLKRIKLGQYNSAESKKKLRQKIIKGYENEALVELTGRKNSTLDNKLHCAMLYWCEGAKHDSCLKFTNSDPELSKSFIHLLRQSFPVDEKKFRPIIHLHDYHDKTTQLEYWSAVLDIPVTQFMKCWRKPNTGKRIKENYQGCVTINYYDHKIAKQLLAYAKIFLKINRPVG